MSFPINALTSLATGPSGETLYLNADNFGNVTVQYSQAPTSSWSFAYVPSLGSVMIINNASGQALTVEDSSSVKTSADLSPSGSNTWTFGGSDPSYAIRPKNNNDLNLNVSGDRFSAGTKVGVYKWDKARNTQWHVA